MSLPWPTPSYLGGFVLAAAIQGLDLLMFYTLEGAQRIGSAGQPADFLHEFSPRRLIRTDAAVSSAGSHATTALGMSVHDSSGQKGASHVEPCLLRLVLSRLHRQCWVCTVGESDG